MAWHHIIPRHEWRERFGNLEGFNHSENRVQLTTEQHAQVHLHYFNEITHIEYDRIAGLAITKQIGKEEIQRALGRIVGLSSRGKKHTDKQNQQKSERQRGRVGNRKGSVATEETKRKMSESLRGHKGYIPTLEQRRIRSERQRGKKRGGPKENVI